MHLQCGHESLVCRHGTAQPVISHKVRQIVFSRIFVALALASVFLEKIERPIDGVQFQVRQNRGLGGVARGLGDSNWEHLLFTSEPLKT